MQMLEQFKNFQIDQVDMDELVMLKAVGESLRTQYQTLGLDEPDWLTDNLKTIAREIRSRNADRVEKLIRDKRARLASLMTTEEKREKLRAELAELEKQEKQQVG